MELWDLNELKGMFQPSHLEGAGLTAPICRIGSKKKFATLLDYIVPPHQTYVEPFVGSGAFFWHKEPSEKEVVNDLEPEVVSVFKLIREAPTDLSKYPQDLNTLPKIREFFAKPATSVPAKLSKLIIRMCNGFMSQPTSDPNKIYKATNPFKKLKNIEKYKERLEGVKVESMDYGKVIDKYDGPNTFFFLDPPYENSKGFGYAEEESFNFERFAEKMKSIKGKWLVTLNDSPRIRELFRWAHQYPITIIGHHALSSVGSHDRGEILLSNYELPKGWRSHTGRALRAKATKKLKVKVAPMSKEAKVDFTIKSFFGKRK